MIHITEDQVREALPVTKAVELVEDGFRRLSDGRAVNQPRRRVVLDNGACLHYMAAGENAAGYLATKVYATRPRVGARFAVLLFDAETIELLASIDANVLGQIRTGAASGVATRHMAREDAATLAMIGSGFQAETQLEAVAAVRKLKRVRVYSRSPERREAFARRMSQRLVLPIEAAARAEDAISEATIVVTVTTARETGLRLRRALAWLPHQRRRQQSSQAGRDRCRSRIEGAGSWRSIRSSKLKWKQAISSPLMPRDVSTGSAPSNFPRLSPAPLLDAPPARTSLCLNHKASRSKT